MKKFFLYAQALFYAGAGVNHFINGEGYLKFMPSFLPWHMPLIVISGAAELILAILLLPLSTRRNAAWLIVAMLVVFLLLIHIPMAVDFAQRREPMLWLALARLPLQLVFIGWAWAYTRPAAQTNR